MHHTFFYISLPSLHHQDMRLCNFPLYEGHDHEKMIILIFLFLNLQSFRVQLQKNLPTFEELNKMELEQKSLRQSDFTINFV